jgi:tetratricopeptide (TPR) repeat protein
MTRRRLWLIAASVLVAVFGAVQFSLWRLSRAEDRLQEFYAAMADARPEDGRRLIAQAIALCPRDARYRAWSGFAEVAGLRMDCGGERTGEERAAILRGIAAYSQAADLNPHDPVFPYDLAWLHHLLGQNDLALSEFRKAVEANENDALFHASLAMFLEESGHWEQARGEYRNAVALSPELAASHLFRDLSDRRRAETREILLDAIAALEASLKEPRSPVILARLGSLYAEIGEPQQARQDLLAALAALPNLPLAWANLGDLYLSGGDRMAALHSYQRAVFLDRRLVLPNLRLGEWYAAVGDERAELFYFGAAVRNWDRAVPVGGVAARNFRMYRRSRQPLSDLLPPSLYSYAGICEIAKAFAALSLRTPDDSQTSQCESTPSPHAGLR